jgi:hypothetical protein
VFAFEFEPRSLASSDDDPSSDIDPLDVDRTEFGIESVSDFLVESAKADPAKAIPKITGKRGASFIV